MCAECHLWPNASAGLWFCCNIKRERRVNKLAEKRGGLLRCFILYCFQFPLTLSFTSVMSDDVRMARMPAATSHIDHLTRPVVPGHFFFSVRLGLTVSGSQFTTFPSERPLPACSRHLLCVCLCACVYFVHKGFPCTLMCTSVLVWPMHCFSTPYWCVCVYVCGTHGVA